jgi:hypothetical protein
MGDSKKTSLEWMGANARLQIVIERLTGKDGVELSDILK